MEIAKLGSNFRREKMIEDWNSLVWTERYSSNGDFELVSNNIGYTLDMLPLGDLGDPPTLVSIDESDVPMVVESHKIEKKKNSPPQIVTSGRSFETVLDRRIALQAVTSGVPRAEWLVEATSSAFAAHAVIKAIVVDGVASSDDIMSEISLVNAVADVGPSIKYPVEPKELYAWAIETLALGKYGMRSIMPSGIDTDITIQIYEGVDRTTEVVFDVALDQVKDPAYFLSNVGHKNVMITSTANGMEYSANGTMPTGLSRRVGFQDLSSEVTVPAGAELTNLTINKGKIALADLYPIALFSGGIAENISSGYDSSYKLGDVVTLQGEYGLYQLARVAEFVRTHDNTGIKAYPTFEAVTP